MPDRIGGALALRFSVSSAPPMDSSRARGRSGLLKVSGPSLLPDVGGSGEFQTETLSEKKYLLTQSSIQRTPKNELFCGLCIGIFLCAVCVKLHLDLILNSRIDKHET
jgi:hypothetical protein